MAEMGTGVYVSRTDTDEWQPDEEVGGSAHILFEDGGSIGGLWKAEPDGARGPVEVELPARETLLVLAGDVRVGVEGSPELELAPGDMTSLPKGARITWDPSPGCTVFWVYS